MAFSTDLRRRKDLAGENKMALISVGERTEGPVRRKYPLAASKKREGN